MFYNMPACEVFKYHNIPAFHVYKTSTKHEVSCLLLFSFETLLGLQYFLFEITLIGKLAITRF